MIEMVACSLYQYEVVYQLAQPLVSVSICEPVVQQATDMLHHSIPTGWATAAETSYQFLESLGLYT